MKKKILSFCIWGDMRLYCIGAIKNAVLAEKIFPDWICRFYYDSTVPKLVIEKLKLMNNTETIFVDIPSGGKSYKGDGQFGMIWKFYPFDDNDVEIWCSRDIDSRISKYEKEEMDKFIESDKCIHSFRDNNEPKLRGGMTSFKNFSKEKDNRYVNGKKIIIKDLIDNFVGKKNTPFYSDEKFLNNVLLKYYKGDYYCSPRKFSIPQPKYMARYVGDVVDEYDKNIDKNGDKSFEKKNNYDDLENIIDEFKKRTTMKNIKKIQS